VYGGVPVDLARSELPLSITVPLGSELQCSYSASRRNHTVLLLAPDNSKCAIATPYVFLTC
jgi:hypothetical protein